MTLNGVGEPEATECQKITQALNIELYGQWQTYNNGVHLKRSTFDSIDFDAMTSVFQALRDAPEIGPSRDEMPRPTRFQMIVQALTMELFRQWHTPGSGVRLERDTFYSIDFAALASAAFAAVRPVSEWNAIPG